MSSFNARKLWAFNFISKKLTFAPGKARDCPFKPINQHRFAIHQSTKNQELQIVRYPHPLRSMSRGLFHTNTPANFRLDKNPEKLYIFSKTAWSKLLFRRHFLFVKVILSLTMCKARRGERWSHPCLGLLAPSRAVSRKKCHRQLSSISLSFQQQRKLTKSRAKEKAFTNFVFFDKSQQIMGLLRNA